ncbi:MAG: glycosyltransferase [Candidatus Scalindua sp.]
MTQHDIIFIAADPWEHYTWRRRHHVAWNLAKNNRVLFVEPPLTFLQPFRDIDLNWKHLLTLGRLRNPGRMLYTYSPVRLLPLSLPGSQRLNYYERDKQRTFRRLKRIMKKLSFHNPVLWVYYSEPQYDYYNLFDEKIRVADWYDKFGTGSGVELTTSQIKTIKKREENILKNSNVIFASSRMLYDDLKKEYLNSYYVPHGVDYESFVLKSKKTKRQDILHIHRMKGHVLCYLGVLHYRVDFELLDFIAETHPEWSMILMGMYWLHNSTDKALFDSLIKRRNVTYLGEIQRKDIPLYLESVDVCLVPNKRIEFNLYSAQLKILEYLAAGKPIVAVDLGIEYEYSDFIRIAKTKENFAEMIGEALEDEGQNGESLAEARKKIARHNSWESRVNQMIEIIDSHLYARN